MELSKSDREFIEGRIINLKKYIESLKDQIKEYEDEASVLQKVLE